MEPVPGGYRVIDASGMALAFVYGQPDGAIGFSEAGSPTARLPNHPRHCHEPQRIGDRSVNQMLQHRQLPPALIGGLLQPKSARKPAGSMVMPHNLFRLA
jgi:hypothetical protein